MALRRLICKNLRTCASDNEETYPRSSNFSRSFFWYLIRPISISWDDPFKGTASREFFSLKLLNGISNKLNFRSLSDCIWWPSMKIFANINPLLHSHEPKMAHTFSMTNCIKICFCEKSGKICNPHKFHVLSYYVVENLIK